MKLYRIEYKHSGGPKYAWTSGYGPTADSIDDIPFLKDTPTALKDNLQKSWEINKSPPGIEFDSGGKEWPDVLGCGGGPPHFFISERILTDLQNAGVPYLRVTEMPLVQPFPKKLRDVPPPKYFVLEGIAGLEVSWSGMGIPFDENNRMVRTTPLPKPWPPDEWKVSRSSWTGLDLMSYKNWQMPMTLVCTDEIKDIAKARNWTNIMFRPLVTVE